MKGNDPENGTTQGRGDAAGTLSGYDWSRPTKCGLGAQNDTWSISAGLLNVWWGELFPRLAARVWRDSSLAWPSSSTDPHDWFANRIDEFLPQPVPDPGNDGGACFQSRIDELRTYLRGSDPKIPVNFWGEGAYDFVLSDKGLDLFAPPTPPEPPPSDPTDDWEFRKKVYHLFTFRRTGRRPIGLPSGSPGSSGSQQIAAPTGPSQILVPRSALAPGDRSDPCVETDGRDTLLTMGPQGDVQEEGAVTVKDLDCFLCLLRKSRCWQVEGAVWRGILEENPRIVATIWWDQSGSPVPTNPIDMSGYWAAYGNDANDGHRAIFRERMETSLPEQDEMAFTQHPGSAPSGLFWKTDDVMITNRGIFFPRLPQLPPTRKELLDQIVEGKAGNPVFTDSGHSWA